MISKTRATTADAILTFADVLVHGSCSLWFQNRLETITAVVLAVLTPGVGFAGGRLVEESNEAPGQRASPPAGRRLGRRQPVS
jgi:hypothetical protein